jgi:small subunit ribosomal protein S16
MSVKIRLKRMGAVGAAFNKIIICDTKKQRDGRVIEEIGIYDPTKEPALIKINRDKALYWLSKGATPSETVKSLFRKIAIKV